MFRSIELIYLCGLNLLCNLQNELLIKKNTILEKNISSLFRTAQEEIRRKDERIMDLLAQLQELKGQSHRSHDNERPSSKHYSQSSSSARPYHQGQLTTKPPT